MHKMPLQTQILLCKSSCDITMVLYMYCVRGPAGPIHHRLPEENYSRRQRQDQCPCTRRESSVDQSILQEALHRGEVSHCVAAQIWNKYRKHNRIYESIHMTFVFRQDLHIPGLRFQGWGRLEWEEMRKIN